MKEPACIAIWDGKECILTEIFYEVSHSDSHLKFIPEEGTALPLHCTCAGKIILANMTEEELDTCFRDKTLKSYTYKTIVNINHLKDQLRNVKEQNIAYDDEEYILGVRGISSGIRDHQGRILGAICIYAPSVRLTDVILKKIAPIIKVFASRISGELGYLGENFPMSKISRNS